MSVGRLLFARAVQQVCVCVSVLLTGESAHDFAFQFLGHRLTELGGYFSCYILG